MSSEPQSVVQTPFTHAEIRSIIVGIMVAMLLAALDQTIVATAMATIGRELGDVDHLPWVVTSYLLASTAVTQLYGKFSDIRGRRVTLQIAIAVFVAGSVACALSTSMIQLILARGLQGMGGGGLISLAQTIIADIVSPRQRSRYQVYIAAVFATSSIAGPVLGGFFAEHLHWSLIFWINVPLGLAAYLMTNSKLKRLPRHERPHRLDVIGALIMVSATVSFMLALNWGGLRYPWGSPQVIGLMIVSVLLWLAFAWRLRTAPEPLIPGAVLANAVVARGTIAAGFGMGVFIGMTIYMPIYFETVFDLTASWSGIAAIPLMAGTVTGATLSGRIMANFTHYKRIPTIGLVISTLTLALLAIEPRGLPIGAVAAMLAVASIGLGTVLPVTTVCIQNAVAQHQMGTATATMNFFRQLGGAVIVATFGAILLNSLPGGTSHGGSLEGIAAVLRDQGRDIAFTFRWVFAAGALGLLISCTALIAMEERPLRTQITREQVPAE